MPADGGGTITDLAVPRDQGEVFVPTSRHRRPGGCRPPSTNAYRTGSARPALDSGKRAGNRRPECTLPGPGHRRYADHLPLRERPGRTHPQGGFGFHPLVCLLANTGEAVSGRLRPGNAGANTAPRITSPCWAALSRRSPDAHRPGTARQPCPPSLSAPTAPDPRQHSAPTSATCGTRGIRTVFSVGYAVIEPVRPAGRPLPRPGHPGAVGSRTCQLVAHGLPMRGGPVHRPG